VEKVTPQEWDAYKSKLRETYDRMMKLFRENPTWDDGTIGGSLSIVVHTAYHLGEIRQALSTGEYITPSNGDYAGQLGPWAGLVETVGIDPYSTMMKTIFVAYGLSALVGVAGFLTDQPWGRSALLIMAVLGLWYLPIGTAVNIVVLILLFLKKG
jgi:hypothetical protein